MKIDINQIKEKEKINLTSEKTEKQSDDIDFKDFLNYLPNNALSFMPTGTNFNPEDFITEDEINGIKASYSYDVLRMDRDDAMFFASAVKGEEIVCNMNGEVFVNNITNPDKITETEQVYKSAAVSRTLMNMLSESMNKNKPVRIDFGNDISAVIKVDKEGRIAAEFIPSDKAAEEFLKNNLSYLRETFEKEDIPYNALSYRQQKRQNKNNEKESRGE